MQQAAGIVLAGGRSGRMGAPKASLEWHGSTLLRRIAGILARALGGPLVIVRAEGQVLPRVPATCEVVDDGLAGRGPMQGLAAGLGALAGRAELAFVAATDIPMLHPAFIGAVLARLRPEDDICVPVLDGVAHPLAAAYRTALHPVIAELLAADQLRLGLLLERCRVRRVGAAELLADPRLAGVDPKLESLLNLNGPGDYAAARARPAPEISLRRPSDLPGGGPSRAVSDVVRAATLAEAAAAAGVVLGGGTGATLNGCRAGEDLELPLVSGDVLLFTEGRADRG